MIPDPAYDILDHHRVWQDWRPRTGVREAQFPGDGAGCYGAPLGAVCTAPAHADAGAWCDICRGTGHLPVPTPRPCRAVP